MKLLSAFAFAILTNCFSFKINAQLTYTTVSVQNPRWTSSEGYWVLELKPAPEFVQTVYFYTDQNYLIHQEIIVGKQIDLSRRKVQRRLRKILEEKMIAWQNNNNVVGAVSN